MENKQGTIENKERFDDGSLDFLQIPADETNKQFNCKETNQQNLINTTFWVCDFFEGMKTKFGENRVLVKIKMNLDDPDKDARKFFTNRVIFGTFLTRLRSAMRFLAE